MNNSKINYHLINLGPKLNNRIEHHNFAFNNVKVSQIDSHQFLNIYCQNEQQNGQIKILTDGKAKDSLYFKSLRGGIEIQCPENNLNCKSNKTFFSSKEIYISSINLCSLKSKMMKIDSNNFLLTSFEDIEIKCNSGKIKLFSNNIDNDSISLVSSKGGIKIVSKSKLEMSADNYINLNCFDSDSEINIGTSSKNRQIINVGNDKSIISLNNDVYIKGNIISNDSKIEKITTCLSETSESILLLSKDNNYSSKNTGFVSRNVNKYIGFLFDTHKNEFYMSDNLKFSRIGGITNNISFSKLKIGELDVNGHVSINKFGNIKCNSLKGNNFNIEQSGDVNLSGHLNINNQFKINSTNGSCVMNGQLTTDGMNINNIFKNNIGTQFKFKTIKEWLYHIQNKKKNNPDSILYLVPQKYSENIIIQNFLINIEGNHATLLGIIDINNEISDFLSIENEQFISNFFFIRDLEIVINQEQQCILNMGINKPIQYNLTNINFYIGNNVNKLFEFNNENGTVILDNINIYSYLDFKVKYIFKIIKIKKLVIKNSLLVGTNLIDIKDKDTKIIITNCYINCKITSVSNIILYNNIIKNRNDSHLIMTDTTNNRFI